MFACNRWDRKDKADGAGADGRQGEGDGGGPSGARQNDFSFLW